MNTLQMQVSIVGAVLPFALSFAKRYIKMDSKLIGLVTMLLCLIAAAVSASVSGEFEAKELPEMFILVYGTSQVIYKGLMKPTGMDVKMEGK